jgi:hypothetical protein
VNGRGLVNGNGLVNGTGLVNGNGLTNGLSRVPIRRNTFGVVTNKDLRVGLALVMLGLLVIPVVSMLLMEPKLERYEPSITIDGDFSDWEDVPKYVDQADGRRPDATVHSYSIDLERNHLSFYVQGVGIVLGDIDGYDSWYFFIDSDGDSSTGYKIRNFGANFVIQAYGGDNIVSAAQMHTFLGDDQTNWSAFTETGKVGAVTSGRMMEVQTTIHSLDLQDDFLVLFCANDYEGGQSCSSVPVGKDPGALLVEQTRLRSVVERRPEQIMEVNFTAMASDVTVSDMTVAVSGGATVETPQVPFTVAQGSTTTKLITADLTLAPVGALITATVESVMADRPPSIRGEAVRAYVEEIPPGIVIDGFFEDWTSGNPDPEDLQLGSNADIVEYDSVEGTSEAFFHVRVSGEILEGTFAPQMKNRVIQGMPGEPTPPAPTGRSKTTGDDYLMIYIDSNSSEDSGEMFYGVMANAIVEIKGMYGVIKQKGLWIWTDGVWEEVAGINAEIDADEIEISVLLGRLGILDDSKMVFVTSTWNMIGDFAFQQTDWRTRSRTVYLVEQDGSGTHTGLSMHRKVFFTGSYFFAFYYNGGVGSITWEWSINGKDWSNAYSNAFVTGGIYYVSVWYNASDSVVYIVGAKSTADTDVYVRRGTVTGNVITWGGSENSITVSSSTAKKNASIAVSSEGYVWIASAVYNLTGYNINVTRSTAPEVISFFGAPTPLSTDQADTLGPVIVPLKDNDMYCAFNRNGNIKGNYYDGSSGLWSTEVTIASDGKDQMEGGPSLVVDYSAYIHFVYADTSGVIKHLKYTTSWGSPTTLDSGSDAAYPTVSLVPTEDIYAFWINETYEIAGKISSDGGSTWVWNEYITDDSVIKWNLTSVYNYSKVWGVAWIWDIKGEEVYFERIPEFEFLLVPVVFVTFIPIILRRRHRVRSNAGSQET